MTVFTIRDGQFWLDDQPQFIHAGEFHYFRTPKDQWRHRLGLLIGAGFNTVAAYIPWLWHEVEEGAADVDGHTHPLRDLAGFLDLATEMGLMIIARPGPYIMAETRNEGIPPWFFERYPQAAYISQDNVTQNVVSYLHPDFLAATARWYQAVFAVLAPRQVTRGGKIIMIQLDNEMGMIQWVRNMFDINPDTLARFAVYLRKTYYGALPAVYSPANLVEILRSGLQNPTPESGRQIAEDYRRFYRDYLHDYMAWLCSAAASCGMEVPPVVNIHGFGNGGKTFPIGLSQLVKVMGLNGMVSATDVYPIFINEGNFHQMVLVNEMTKALQNPRQALFSIEFQAGGNMDFGTGESSLYDLHSRLCISTGMRAINHYLFFDGENDPILSSTRRHDWGHPVRKDGSLRGQYHRYPRLSKVINAYGADLVLSRPQTVTAIGFVLDYFMTEVTNAATKQATAVIAHQRDQILFDFIGRGLALTHRPFHAVEIGRGRLDAARTPLCWVMLEKQCSADTQQMLVDYARAGGRLILVGRMCTEDFAHRTCTILKSALGIEQMQTDPAFTGASIEVFQYPDTPAAFVESYTGDFERVFATRRASQEVVGFIKTLDKGRVMMFGASIAANTLDDLDVLDQMALAMDCPRLFQLSAWADVRISRGENGSFLFVNNYQDDPLETRVESAGAALFGGSPVPLPARSGLILPLEWQVRPGVLLHYATAEIIAVSQQDGDLILKTQPAEFCAEMTLTGWICEQAQPAAQGRVLLQSKQGQIVLRKGG